MKGLKTLISGKSSAKGHLEDFRPAGFSTPGLVGRFNEATNTFGITRTSALGQGLGRLQKRLGERASAFRDLRGSSAFEDLIRGRVDAIRRAGSRATGNLREELSKRRVIGSSFAQREIAGVEAEFGEREKLARAEGRRDQLSVEAALIDQEFQASVEAVSVMVDQMNLEAGLGAQMSQFTGAQMFERARLRAELDASIEGMQIEWLAMERAMGHDVGMSFLGGAGGGGAGMMGAI